MEYLSFADGDGDAAGDEQSAIFGLGDEGADDGDTCGVEAGTESGYIFGIRNREGAGRAVVVEREAEKFSSVVIPIVIPYYSK